MLVYLSQSALHSPQTGFSAAAADFQTISGNFEIERWEWGFSCSNLIYLRIQGSLFSALPLPYTFLNYM